MRKHLVWCLAAILAISVAGYAWARAGTEHSTSTIGIKPSKLSKTKFKPIKLAVETTTLNDTNGGTATNPSTQPYSTQKVDLTFDDDLKFTTKGIGQCDSSTLQSTTTAQAKTLCGKEQVGAGSATVCLAGGQGSPCSVLPAVVTAFNGKPNGGKPTIILHARVDQGAVHSTQVLVGTLKSGGTGDFDKVLDVPVPQTPAISLTQFQTTVGGKIGPKHVQYVTARCHDSNKQINLKGKFQYAHAGEPTDNTSGSAKCST